MHQDGKSLLKENKKTLGIDFEEWLMVFLGENVNDWQIEAPAFY
jgi:hypothetical protein